MFDLRTTPQQIFEIMAKHLLGQNARAQSHDGYCHYLAPDGKKCGVGILIPDRHPAQKIMDNINGVLNQFDDLYGLYGEHLSLLKEIQTLHDKIIPELWGQELQLLASRLRLNTSFLTNPTPTLTEADYAEMLEPMELVAS